MGLNWNGEMRPLADNVSSALKCVPSAAEVDSFHPSSFQFYWFNPDYGSQTPSGFVPDPRRDVDSD